MNPDTPQPSPEELEARLTALLLDELPAEEAAALRLSIEQDSELVKLYERLNDTIKLVREAVATPAEQTTAQPASLKLSDERRQKLLAHFKTVAPKEFAPPRRRDTPWMVPMSIAAMLVALIGLAVLLPEMSRRRPYGVTPLPTHSARMQVDLLRTAPSRGDNGVSTQAAAESAPDVSAPESSSLAYSDTYSYRRRLDRQSGPQPSPEIVRKPTFALASPPPAPAIPPSTILQKEIILPTAGKPTDALGSSVNELAKVDPTDPTSGARFYDFSGTDVPAGRDGRGWGYPGPSGTGTLTITPGPPAASGVSGGGGLGGSASVTAFDGVRAIMESSTNRFQERYGLRRPQSELAAAAPSPASGPPVEPTTGLPKTVPANEGITSSATIDPTTGLPLAVDSFQRSGAGANGSVALAPSQPQPNWSFSSERRLDEKSTARLGDVELNAKPSGSVTQGFLFDNQPVGEPKTQVQAAGTTTITPKRSILDWKNGDGTLGAHGDKSPDVVAAGTFIQSERKLFDAEGETRSNLELPKTPSAGPRSGAVSDSGIVVNNGNLPLEAVRSVDVVALSEAPVKPANPAAVANEEAVRRQAAAIVLPPAKTETGVQEKSGKAVSLFAAANDTSSLFEQWYADPQRMKEKSPQVSDARELPQTKRETETLRRRTEELKDVLATTVAEPTLAQPSSQPNQVALYLGELRKSSALATREGGRAKALAEELRPKSDGFLAGDIGGPRNGPEAREVQLETLNGAVEQTSAAPQPAQVQDEDRAIRRASTNAPIPQPEVQTCDNTFSTFSLNVSDVSFKLAAASLEKGQMPDAASVRTEEFINAFDYRDPEPPAGVPLAFAWERARYPFAHNRDLLRFSLKTAAAGRQAGRPLNLVLLLDNSGSMERADRVRIIREALRVLAAQLQPHDKISVITFARTPRLWVDGVAGEQAGEIAEQVSGLMPQGGTNLEDAMNLAYQTAARHYLANGMNRVVLLTDGAANLGNVEPDALKQKVEAQRKQGIALDCFGIGWEGFNDDLLEVLSRNGDGRYGFINSPEEAATEFAGQLAGALKVAASDVKVQVEFNPKRVTAYRQIGYAKHQLTKEQFRDNTVDAAEIAAQEAGNALYTVEINPQGDGPLCIVRARFKIPGTSDYREHEWAVPFTANAVSLEQASPAMRLAASASAFSEWLAASPFAGEVTPDRLLGYLGGVPEIYGADARPKKLEWMIRQAKSLEGK